MVALQQQFLNMETIWSSYYYVFYYYIVTLSHFDEHAENINYSYYMQAK